MKKNIIILFLQILIFPLVNAQVPVDWKAFLGRNDMVWNQLPESWDNAPFLGNGRLGTIFWLNQGGALNFEVSRSDLYDHRVSTAKISSLYTRCRLPNGHFELTFDGGKKPEGNMRLDLWNAEAKGQVRSGGNVWDIHCFTHALKNVIVLEISGSGKLHLVWKPDTAKSTRGSAPASLIPYPVQVFQRVEGCDVSVQEMPEDNLYLTAGQGTGQYATAWKGVEVSPHKTVYYISLGVSIPGKTAIKEAVQFVNQSAKEGVANLEVTHRAWWHNYYPKSFVSLPDQAIENFYWIQMYKMASASRGKGPLLDLMGPWFRSTGWPAIWWNLNIQLTYWPFYMSNHLEEAGPLAETIWNQRANLARNAAPYENDSYAIGRASALDLSSPVGGEVGNLPWVMHNLWMYYRSSMDDGFLKERLFPLMKGSFNYLRHIVVKHPDGTFSLPKTASPEYTDAVENSSYTLACLRWLSSTIILTDARLKAHDPIVKECKEIIDHLVPYEVNDTTGFMVGRDMPFAKSHRHWSHLFMIYPFHEYSWNNAEQVPLIKKSLENWVSKPQAFAGYSWLGAASILSDGGYGDKAVGYLKTFLKKSPLPNTLYREGSPVIETPLAFARIVQELLMTSYGNTIRIFPGLPSTWLNATFADFRAEGAFLVTARRKNGTTLFVTIKSLAGEPCRVATGIKGTLKVIGGSKSFKDLGGGIIEIEIPKGKTVTVYSGPKLPYSKVSPVEYTEKSSPWGETKPLK